MAKKVLYSVCNTVWVLGRIGVFGWAIGAGAMAVLGGLGSAAAAGFEAGVIAAKAKEADKDKEEETEEPEENQGDKVEFA